MLGFTGWLARHAPKTAMKNFEKQMNDSDRAVAKDMMGPPDEAIALFTQAFLRGPHGVVADYISLARPWGVRVEDTKVPMAVFHGDSDTMVPLRHSEELAARVPGAKLKVWPGAGHLGTISEVGDVLASLG